MSSRFQPDIIVGIDFGMTCTGVAYSKGPEWAEPKTIQHWPGKLGHELRNKVDTAISYDISSGSVQAWGFLCKPDDESCEFNELFKLYLDPQYVDQSGIAPSIDQAQIWFRDYMHCMYVYINRHFSDTTPRFDTKRIEYVFSVPTTWKSPSLIAAMERLIEAAGFGQRRDRERSSIFLSEAEAAAVYSIREMQMGDVFLVCDAGGGTTDLNVIKVVSTARQRLELRPLSWTEGSAVGSALIDYRTRNILIDRLRPVEDKLSEDLETVITKIIDDHFRTFKCSFGVQGMDFPKLFLPLPGLAPGQDFAKAGIFGSKLVMTSDELKMIFDEQLEKMFGLIDQQLQIVQNSHPRETISYLVLSGGLGSSPYVQQQARERYEYGGDLRLHNAKHMRVLLVAEPQLAVVHGLVIARTQAVKGGQEIYAKRCCPVSYGILCRERYDPRIHIGEDVLQDDYEDEKWAADQIAWIIKQGDIVDSGEGISHQYQHKIDTKHSHERQRSTIVMSSLPVSQLPRSMKAGGSNVAQVCQIEFSLEKIDMKLKNRHWYNTRPKYYLAEYRVKAVVGTGLRFQIWGRNGQLSMEHEELDVQWQSLKSINEDNPQEMPGNCYSPQEMDGNGDNTLYRAKKQI